MQILRGVAGLFAKPEPGAGQQTQLLFGEHFTVYDVQNGWAWGQADLDEYVGYTREDALSAPEAATHRVQAIATPLFIAPDVKLGARELLPMNAKLSVAEGCGRFARLTNGSYVFAAHTATIDARVPDWVSVAEKFVGVPYIWGGKTSAGIDCSGLVQTALEAGGIRAPRDTDMMEAELGEHLVLNAELERGDLIFWKGHVGIMLDAERLVHANGFAMQVSIEPIKIVDERTRALESLPIRSIKRLR